MEKAISKDSLPSFERVLCWAAGLRDQKPAVNSGFSWIRELIVGFKISNQPVNTFPFLPVFLRHHGWNAAGA